jgi:murein DD-endopeptidase MepM/ murein hydrolase activator NlpD
MKTVIIRHSNKLHTIYSNLSKIAPGVKPGRFIKQRNAIGRVKQELKFEVTKEDVPINPFELILKK